MPSRWDNPSGKIHGHSPEDQRTLYIKTIKPLGQTLGRDSLGQLFTSLINRLPTRSQAPCCIARLGHRWPLTLHLTIQCASAGEPSCPEVCTMYFVGAHVHMAMCSHDRSGHKAYHGTLWVSCRSTRPYQENCQRL